MSNADILYKLIILYMLNKVNYPMSNHQLGDYLLENELTDYFTIQKELYSLIDMHYIDKKDQNGKTFYSITNTGIKVLNMFKDEKINSSIKTEIDHFLLNHGYEFRSNNLITCNYYKNNIGEYDVQCKIKDKDNILLDIKISVPTLKQAQICKKNWTMNKEKIYKNILKDLL